MRYILENATGRHVFNRRTYSYDWIEPQGTIHMAHEGRYITLRKEEDDKKEFRYDLATGEFERVNHYKKGDKVSRTKAANITAWFRECTLVTEDKKFGMLYAYAKQSAPNRYKSHVRFIEMFATQKIQIMEQWLSLGITFDKIADAFNSMIESPSYYSSWRDDSQIYHLPSEYNKELLQYVREECEKRGHVSFRFINECYDHWNDGQYEVFKKIEAKIEEEPQYRPVFVVKRYDWDDEYINLLHHESESSLRNQIIQVIQGYNLDLDAFLEYCLYLNHVESVSIKKLMADYPDYLRRELHLKGGRMARMEKYPQTWLSATHKQQQEYKNLQHLERMEKRGNTEKFDNSIEANRHLEWKNGNYLIRMPTGAEDIRDEADQMHHCVATYIPQIEAGEKTVMFMRDIENPDVSLVTVEVIDGAITQAYAQRDTQPSIPCMIWLTKWAHEKDLRITAVTLR
ncbi:MAG: PcfJ domain-containing protein [Clostridia bacterium]|nr:PcfJ domain-containing protein [Clostridia bacterium]